MMDTSTQGTEQSASRSPDAGSPLIEAAPVPRSVTSRLVAELPGVLFRLEQGAGLPVFTYLGEGCRELLGIDAPAMMRSPGCLGDLLQRSDREALESSLTASAHAMTPWQWEGRCVIGTQLKWVQAIAQPRRQRGRVVWTGLLYNSSERHHQECALEQALADLAETVARERLRSEALIATCERLLGSDARAAEAAVVHESTSLRRLALGLAHEINNPLSGIMAMFEAMHESHLLPAAQRREYGRAIAAGLLRIEQTVSGLLQYAQPQPPKLEAMTWSDVLEAACRVAQPALQHKEQQLSCALDSCALPVLGDRQLLAQALINVLLNASHAAPPASTIKVRGERRDDEVRLLVEDAGPGIPREYLHRVCEPFFTTKRQGEGCGLGLATSSRILETHHGGLRIESVEGSGTCVSLWLPMPPAARALKRG